MEGETRRVREWQKRVSTRCSQMYEEHTSAGACSLLFLSASPVFSLLISSSLSSTLTARCSLIKDPILYHAPFFLSSLWFTLSGARCPLAPFLSIIGYPLHFSSSDGQMEQQHWRSWSGLSKHPSGATVLYNFRHHTLNLSVYSYLVQYYYFILCGSCDFFMETLLVLFLFSWHWFPWKLDSTAFDAPLLLIYM